MTSEMSDGDSNERVPADTFPRPPHSMTDEVGRDIDIRVFDGDLDALVTMYEKMDPHDRAQGIPPRTRTQIISWLETLLEEGPDLVARHDDVIVGHATLVPMDDDQWELAIFVRSDYQEAHIGSALMRCLLGYGRDIGIEKVWLSVERHNSIAINLYRRVGFELVSDGSTYHMERSL